MTTPPPTNNPNSDNITQKCFAQNEDYSQSIPPPPPPSTATPNSFFSRMSSLSSTAAPILEQVYDRAHKKAVELKDRHHNQRDVAAAAARSSEPVKDLQEQPPPRLKDDDDDCDSQSGSEASPKEEMEDESKHSNSKNNESETEEEEVTTKSPMKVLGAFRKRHTSPATVGANVALGRKLNNLVSNLRIDDSSDKDANNNNNASSQSNNNSNISTTYKRSNSYYETAIQNILLPNQRALFFGHSTMGVILKPTYHASWRGKDGGGLVSSTSKKGGVFIDALVPGGHAERSGVVFVGDAVVKIGDVDVREWTLEEVVRGIASAERPSVLILCGESEVATNNNLDSSREGRNKFVSPLDLVFGLVNRVVVEGVDGKDHAPMSSSSLLDDDEEEDGEEVLFGCESPKNQLNDLPKSGQDKTKKLLIANNSESDSTNENEAPASDAPTQEEFDKLLTYASQPTNNHDQIQPNLLARAAFLNPLFRNTLHLAFKECCNDPRKANFLVHFFSEYKTRKEETKAKEKTGTSSVNTEEENDAASSTNQRKLLDIYLDLVQFRNEATVGSTKRLLDRAWGIAAKFLPEANDDILTEPSVSEYVAYIAFGGTEHLQSLKRALTDEDEFFEDVTKDGFYQCRENLGMYLSMQEHFLAFLVSDDCARMRAYLRGTSPFLCVEPSVFLTTSNDEISTNFLLFAILHLICMNDGDDDVESSDEYGNFIKMDTMILNQRSGKRVAGASSILSCPIFILRTLNSSIRQAAEGLVEDEMMGSRNNDEVYKKLALDVQILWENFVSPVCGALALCNLSIDAQDALESIRALLASLLGISASQGILDDISNSPSMAKSLTSEEFSMALQNLSDSLIQHYCHTAFPNFQRHISHEWALSEALTNSSKPIDASNKADEYLEHCVMNPLPKGYSKKVLRQLELPRGLSSHLPGSKQDTQFEDDCCEPVDSYFHNADIAVVFGKHAIDDALPKPSSDLSADSSVMQANIQRHACGSLYPDTSSSANVLTTADLPETFEEYMCCPPFRDRPFKGMLRKDDNNRMSIDGWEVSLTNAMVPVGRGSSDMLYCVSLTLSNIDAPAAQVSLDDLDVANYTIEELYHHTESHNNSTEVDHVLPQCTNTLFQSPLFVVKSGERTARQMKVSSELSNFNLELKEQLSLRTDAPNQMIGISLVSKRNVIPAMRHTLSLLYEDVCAMKSCDIGSKYICQPLVDLLSTFSNCSSVEEESLKCILEPYIVHASSPWIQRPLRDQSKEMIDFCGTQVLQSLPPVPLALLFVTALLEQKIVFSSSRRSMLMSASVALAQLMKPFNWTHLLVPHAPMSMVNDLIHYPAPFILGLSTDEKHSANILRSLPSDVTLVDLDVGRVMLASEFVNDDVEMDDDTKASSQSALRSQVLVLAEYIGGIFGSATLTESWNGDSPFSVMKERPPFDETSRFSIVQSICYEFVAELISGISSCCLWIEEGNKGNPPNNQAIIFDEDLFMHIKKCPSGSKHQLNLGQFNLILQVFLRTQSLSTLISAGNKRLSLFSQTASE